MMITGPFIFKEVWAVDTEFHPANGKEGNLPVVVCMVARELSVFKWFETDGLIS